MKRKISLTILLVTGFALFGCGEETVSAHEHTEETVSAHEHTYASSWESSSTHHWHESTCEHDIKKDFAEHAFEDTVTKEATYDSQGSVTHVCKVCDYSYSERIPKLSHNYSNEWSINAQKHWRVCVDEGYEWMKTDLANHTFSIETIEPTCLDEGYDIRTCDVCGYSEKTNYVDALGHEYEDIVYEPTYDAGGYTKHTCKVCGYSYEDAITDKLKYTITWEDWDGSILRVDNLERVRCLHTVRIRKRI